VGASLVPEVQPAVLEGIQEIVNQYEWEGVVGQPAKKVALIDYDYLAEFDVRQADSAVAYIKQHAKDAKPLFMDVNFMKMHNPNNPAAAFKGKSHLGKLFGRDAGAGPQHRPRHGCDPR